MKCTFCKNDGVFRYAPSDNNLTENKRWVCDLHAPPDVFDGEWDSFIDSDEEDMTYLEYIEYGYQFKNE